MLRIQSLVVVLLTGALLGTGSWMVQGQEAPSEKPAEKTEQAAEETAADKPVEKLTGKAAKAAERQVKLEQDFEEQMRNCVLVGRFTVVGKEDEAPKEERYTIDSVKKMRGNYWLFNTRIQYGKTDTKLPLTLRVEWADDTPVITLTDFTIPGMGTFTSRVLIYRGWYAGTWQHGPVGGHLFGKIEKQPAAAGDKPATEVKE